MGHYSSAHCTTTYQEVCHTRLEQECDCSHRTQEQDCLVVEQKKCSLVQDEKCETQYSQAHGVDPPAL